MDSLLQEADLRLQCYASPRNGFGHYPKTVAEGKRAALEKAYSRLEVGDQGGLHYPRDQGTIGDRYPSLAIAHCLVYPRGLCLRLLAFVS